MDEITLTHQELAARRTAHGTTFYIEVDEETALEIASGFVRSSVMAQVRAMLDWQETDERRANRPVKQRVDKKNTKAVKSTPYAEEESPC